jgi:hypothetical protein
VVAPVMGHELRRFSFSDHWAPHRYMRRQRSREAKCPRNSKAWKMGLELTQTAGRREQDCGPRQPPRTEETSTW